MNETIKGCSDGNFYVYTFYTSETEGIMRTYETLSTINGKPTSYKENACIVGSAPTFRKLSWFLYLVLCVQMAVCAVIDSVPPTQQQLDHLLESAAAPKTVYVNMNEDALSRQINEDEEIDVYTGLTIVTNDGHVYTDFINEKEPGIFEVITPGAKVKWNIDNVPLGTWFHHWYTRYGDHYFEHNRQASASAKPGAGTVFKASSETEISVEAHANGDLNFDAAKRWAAGFSWQIIFKKKWIHKMEETRWFSDKYYTWFANEHWVYQRQNRRWMVKRCYGGGSCLHSGDGEGHDFDTFWPVLKDFGYILQDSDTSYYGCGSCTVSWRKPMAL